MVRHTYVLPLPEPGCECDGCLQLQQRRTTPTDRIANALERIAGALEGQAPTQIVQEPGRFASPAQRREFLERPAAERSSCEHHRS
jgi:hypothetical protein